MLSTERRGRQPVRDQRDAGRRHGAARDRIRRSARSSRASDRTTSSLMVKAEGDAEVRARAARRHRRRDDVRGHALRRQRKPIEYYVEADGVRSPTYTMKVVELPAVANARARVRLPGLHGPAAAEGRSRAATSPRSRGTEVRVKITPTMATPAGQLQLDPGTPSGLAAQADGTLTGSFKIDKDGFYHVELDGPRGEKVTASPKYTVDVIEDQPPTVSFEKPKRDTRRIRSKKCSCRRAPTTTSACKQLDLVYSVNGGAEKTVTLYGKGAKPLHGSERRPHGVSRRAGREARRLRVLLREGDRHRHGARARRARRATSTSSRSGRSTRTSAGAVAAGRRRWRRRRRRQQNQAGALSEQQRQIISATFNVERDAPKTAADKFKEDTVFVSLSQSKLRERGGRAGAADAAAARRGDDENIQQDRRAAAEGRRGDEGGRGAAARA